MCATHESTTEGATRPLTPCSLCNGREYLIVPTFGGDFAPGTATEPCPKCQPYVPPKPLPWKLRAALAGIALLLLWLFFGGVR